MTSISVISEALLRSRITESMRTGSSKLYRRVSSIIQPFFGLAAIQRDDLGIDDWVKMALGCGEAAYKAMEFLDAGNTSTYGHPVPTKVPLGYKKGKAILVSGHDLKDLEELFKQAEGKGINIYTHGEMLATHGYPKLKKYPHF